MVVVNLKSSKDYEEYLKFKDIIVLHFFAEWAAQCAQMNDVIDEMANSKDYESVRFAKVLAEDVPEISLKLKVTAVPTVLILKNGTVVDRVDGANPAVLTKKVKQFSTKDTLPVRPSDTSKEDLETRLKKLINQAPCMLFMKGTPTTPRCGFSRTIISLLDSYNTDYQTFDILLDNEVREGLKKFSEWPTYPQLYVNGELLGGLDIVKEMSESGELDKMLPKKVGVKEA
ncbi:glutaredoxin-3 [Orussus abietinus]|uniref:glutaredoxin-3 n=1 Tax=Orussus abietinus TaxID=222816 RepID=UPI000626A4AA|nr:glutaredoxin-3 [Orussus abietinus]